MKSIPVTILLCLIITVGAKSQSQNFIYKDLLKKPSADYYHMAVGICEDYPPETTTPAKIRGDMEVMKAAGVKFLRFGMGWDHIETAKGVFNWSFWDQFVKIAVDQYGMTLIPYFCYTPKWNSTGDTSNYWNHTPIDYNEFGKFVYEAVSRYKDKIKSWEIWNEADIPDFWSGNVADYAKILKIGSDAVRKADPKAIVVLAGLAWNTNFTYALFHDYDISKYVDVVNIHSYNETWSGLPLERLYNHIQRISDIVEQYGNHQSIWLCEVGYSDFRKGAYVSYNYDAKYAYEHTPEYQANELFRTLTLIMSTGKAAATAWYRIEDLPVGTNVIGDVNNDFLGVVNTRFQPKPAEKALKFFVKFFKEKNRCIDSEVTITRNIGSNSIVHVFRNEDGSVAVVAWLQTHVPGTYTKTKSGNMKDQRVENISVSIPMKLSTQALAYNELGDKQAEPHITAESGHTVVGLSLKGGQICIIRIPK